MTSDPSSPLWWRDLLERLIRNEIQILSPIFAVVASTGRGADWQAVGWAALVVLTWTTVKFMAGITADPTAPWWLQVLDRAGSAAAGALLAVVPENLHGIDWPLVGWSTLGSVVMALFMFYGTPPSKGAVVDHKPEHLAE